MNEYTRRDEVRWTLIASLAMVLLMAPAVVLLVTAKGKLVPDPGVRAAAEQAAERLKVAQACVVSADRLAGEIVFLRASATVTHVSADEPDGGIAGGPRPRGSAESRPFGRPVAKAPASEPDAVLAWSAAQPSQKAAKLLAPCRKTTEALTGARPEATPAWEAITRAAAIAPAAADRDAELNASRTLLRLLSDIPSERVVRATKDAEAAQKTKTDTLKAKAETAMVTEPIPEGLIPRRMAVGVGVALSVLALLLSYVSVRVASNRRLRTLIPLREAAKAPESGLHAAAVLRLSAQPSGGLPGPVIGGALGGLLAAALQPVDTDLFIGGVMVGFLIGLMAQLLAGVLVGISQWRARVTELADVEKPAIPMVLVLSSVKPDMEGRFIEFICGLSNAEAAKTVEKLAAQAEERILAAADAGASQTPCTAGTQSGRPPHQGPMGPPPYRP